jgi:quercetin dioxygenase-like cupin family protein
MMNAGAEYPYHNHPGVEELLVLEGEVRLNGQFGQAIKSGV